MVPGDRVCCLPVGIMALMRGSGIKTSPTLGTPYISNDDDHRAFSVSRKTWIALSLQHPAHSPISLRWCRAGDVAVVRQSRKHFMKLNNMQLESRNRSSRSRRRSSWSWTRHVWHVPHACVACQCRLPYKQNKKLHRICNGNVKSGAGQQGSGSTERKTLNLFETWNDRDSHHYIKVHHMKMR